MSNIKRRVNLSGKLNEMGKALIVEGDETNDYIISRVGDILSLVGGLIYSEDDIFLFTEFCVMFSSKKILDSIRELEGEDNLVKRLKTLTKEENTMKVNKKKNKK